MFFIARVLIILFLAVSLVYIVNNINFILIPSTSSQSQSYNKFHISKQSLPTPTNRIQNGTFLYDTNYKQICTAKSYPLILPFIEEQWYKARKDLNLSHQQNNNELVHSDHNRYIDLMYRFHRNTTLYRFTSSIIGYLRLLKCGSESILFNFYHYADIEKQNGNRNVKFAKLTNRDEFLNFKDKILNKSRYDSRNSLVRFMFPHQSLSLKLFTFIRHPIKKLESGWTEALSRNGLVHLTTMAQIRQYYIDILSYKNLNINKPLKMIEHIYPMSGAFFHFDVDILLAQEHFQQNWENIVVPQFGLIPNIFNSKLGYHGSSLEHPTARAQFVSNSSSSMSTSKKRNRYDDVHKFRKQLFRSIKTKDPSLWLAMCRLILIDYVCFPQYQLPASCSSLQSEVERGRSSLTTNLS